MSKDENIEFVASATGYYNGVIVARGSSFYAPKTLKAKWAKAVLVAEEDTKPAQTKKTTNLI